MAVRIDVSLGLEAFSSDRKDKRFLYSKSVAVAWRRSSAYFSYFVINAQHI